MREVNIHMGDGESPHLLKIYPHISRKGIWAFHLGISSLAEERRTFFGGLSGNLMLHY